MLCAGNCENFPGNILQTTPYFTSLAACEDYSLNLGMDIVTTKKRYSQSDFLYLQNPWHDDPIPPFIRYTVCVRIGSSPTSSAEPK